MFTENDHLKFFIEESAFQFRTNPFEKYKVIYGVPDRYILNTSSWDNENRNIFSL